jgi:protein-L-isoaspartate(D-aspartate) O-methyltransferase
MGARRASRWWRHPTWLPTPRGGGRGGPSGAPMASDAGERVAAAALGPVPWAGGADAPPADLNAARGQLLAALRAGGVTDERVLAAMARVPRERFVAPELRSLAYANVALPIGDGQTISQPLMVAMMTQALEPGDEGCVLEIGTGSGYQTAVLAERFGCVVSVERLPALAERARTLLRELGYTGVEVYERDGTLGWPARGPYRRMLVAAAAPVVPAPLVAQLALGGRLVIPVGAPDRQDLMVVERGPDGVVMRRLGVCVFVPLIGAAAWPERER